MSGPTAEKAFEFGIPDRWMYCPKIGQIIEDLFVPFKTPLCELYDKQIEKEHRFYPLDVFESAILNGRKIGLWCDFTKTDRFYDKSEIERYGCSYRKIKMEGHGSSPTEDQVDEFILAVRNFIKNRTNNELVAVHCTHGFNRTGFAIVSYMVKEMNSAVEYAIQTFALHRPCGIYKQDYIYDLFHRFGDIEDCIEAPDRPSWEYGDDISVDFSKVKNSCIESGVTKQFMDGKVDHVYWVADQCKKEMIRQKVKQLVGSVKEGFPGLQPVSLTRENIQLIYEHQYEVSWKADGMRYMIFIFDEEVYALDRDNEIFEIRGLRFPHRKLPRSVTNVLLDAEMIIDVAKENDNILNIPRLLIYDIIHFEECSIKNFNYGQRKGCIATEIIGPRKKATEEGTLKNQPISVRQKEFYDISLLPKLIGEKFRSQCAHEIDGLIFQPVSPPYTPGRSDLVLKWKPPSHNSVDFLLKIKKEVRPGLLPEYWGDLHVLHMNERFARMRATKKLQPYDNKIIECTYDKKMGWQFMRERTDKSFPNAFNTAKNVLNSIVYPVTESDLLRCVNDICNKRKEQSMRLKRPPVDDSEKLLESKKPKE